MKKTHMRKSNKTARRTNNQRGSTKNWFANLNRQSKKRVKVTFVLIFALLGAYIVVNALATNNPRYFGHSEYWMERVRACETGDGVWGAGAYDSAGGGAFNYSNEVWSNFGGYQEAHLAPPEVQEDKFSNDWNDPAVGSKPWEDSMDCWKPAGTIAGAPCVSVPKTPTQQDLVKYRENWIQIDPHATDYWGDPEFGYEEYDHDHENE